METENRHERLKQFSLKVQELAETDDFDFAMVAIQKNKDGSTTSANIQRLTNDRMTHIIAADKLVELTGDILSYFRGREPSELLDQDQKIVPKKERL